jgi:hypothetical protein
MCRLVSEKLQRLLPSHYRLHFVRSAMFASPRCEGGAFVPILFGISSGNLPANIRKRGDQGPLKHEEHWT